jgi:hypothetical protein
VIVWIVLFVAMLVLVAILMRGGSGSAEEVQSHARARAEWRADQDLVDAEEMLRLHNADRVERGLRPRTMAEFTEGVRRDPGAR